MNDFKHISAEQARQLLAETPVIIADIRDELSFQQSRIKGAVHLDNSNVASFINDNDHGQPVLVYCYHGHSSQNAAQFIASQGFTTVYSLDGGFEHWRQQYPTDDETAD